MSERQNGPYDNIARRWLALAERRQAHILELRDSGRWKHYFSEAEIQDEVYKVMILRDQWAEIVGLPLQQDQQQIIELQQNGFDLEQPQEDRLPRHHAGPLTMEQGDSDFDMLPSEDFLRDAFRRLHAQHSRALD